MISSEVRLSIVGALLLISSCCSPRDPGRAPTAHDLPHPPGRGAATLEAAPAERGAPPHPRALDAGRREAKGLTGAVRIAVAETARVARRRSLVTAGVPLPPDGVTTLSGLAIRDRSGTEVPASFRVLARWGGAPENVDRTVSFALVDFLASVDAGGRAEYSLVSAAPPRNPSVTVERRGAYLVMDSGAARFTVPATTLQLISRVERADGVVLLDRPAWLSVDGRPLEGTGTAEVVSDSGLVAEVILRGRLREGLGVTARIRVVQGETALRVALRLENRNPCQADNDGQPTCDDIGSPGSVAFDDLSLVLRPSFPTDGPAWLDGARGPAARPFQRSISLFQGSAGHAHWDALRGYGRRLQAAVRQRESQVIVDGQASNGLPQATGWLDVGGDSLRLTIGVAEMWQSFPKSLRRTEAGAVEIGLFPGEYGQDHVLRAGEHKTHDLIIRFHADTLDVARARALDLLNPLHGAAPVEWFAHTLAAGPVGPRDRETLREQEEYIDCLLTTCPAARTTNDDIAAPNLLAALEQFDVYGYIDYGDIPTDFENGRSPYNLKYDVIRGGFFTALETGDERWWELARAGARHYADIDVLHSHRSDADSPRLWFDGGAYGHCNHDEDGRENPHRNHGRPHPMFTFGTPGLFLGYLLTGDPFLREAGLELAENHAWRLRNSVHEGPCASRIRRSSCRPGEDCEGWAPWSNERVNANYLNTFLWAYRVTGDLRWWEFLREGVSYQACTDAAGVDMTDRLHFQAAAFRAIGEYQLLRRSLGLEDDPNATEVLRGRWRQLSTAPAFEPVGRDGAVLVHEMDGQPAREHNNWVLGVADALAFAAILDGDWATFDRAALPFARTGGRDPWYPGDGVHYHSAKELVNAVGAAHVLRYALWLRRRSR